MSMLPINGDESRSAWYNFYFREFYIPELLNFWYDTNGIIFTSLAPLETKRRKKRKNSIIPIVHSCVLRTRFFFSLCSFFRVDRGKYAPSILLSNWEHGSFTYTNPFLDLCIPRSKSPCHWKWLKDMTKLKNKKKENVRTGIEFWIYYYWFTLSVVGDCVVCRQSCFRRCNRNVYLLFYSYLICQSIRRVYKKE